MAICDSSRGGIPQRQNRMLQDYLNRVSYILFQSLGGRAVATFFLPSRAVNWDLYGGFAQYGSIKIDPLEK